MSEVKHVTAAKPKTGGAIYVAPVGTPLPTDAISDLDAAFRGMGYVSEDGTTNDTEMETENIKAWGGDTVLVTRTSREDTFGFTLIEALSVAVLQYVYGAANVSGTLESGIEIKVNNKVDEAVSVVIDMILNGGVLKRIVVPNGSVSDVGTITYRDNEPVGYETTLSCVPDTAENTHYEYIIKPARPTPPVPTPTTFTVTQNLTNVTSSSTDTQVEEGTSFTATLTADSGYTISTVEVKMGGSDITSTAYDDTSNTVTVAAVTGDLVITATAA